MVDATGKNDKAACIYALLSVLMWSTVASAFKLALRDLDYAQLLLYSSITALIILAIVVVFKNKTRLVLSFKPKEYALSAVLGLLNPCLYYIVLFKAYSLLPAQQAQPLNFTWPIVLVLFSSIFLKQKIGWRSVAAVVISFAGVVVISTNGSFAAFKDTDALGVGLAVGSSVIWAAFWLLNTRDRRDDEAKLFLNFLFGTIFVAIFAFIGGIPALPPVRGLLGAAYVGAFEMGVTFVLWQRSLRLARNAAQVGNLIYLSPFISLFFIGSVVGERIHVSTLVGLGLIVAGIVAQQWLARRRRTGQ
ncbi:MAG: DMT family transporter [Planctomycetota bacterium]|nr:DMT family transporter [Planctomycetota bacterium]